MARSGTSARPALTIVVPALDEAEALPETLRALSEVCGPRDWVVVVVDDGSSDETAKVAEKGGAHVIRHKLPRGYGGALKSGLAAVEGPWAVTFDADGQHDPEGLPDLLAVAVEADADLLVGDRGRGTSSTYRSVGKWVIRALTRVLMPNSVRDLNSGLKLYRTPLAQRYLGLCPDTMAFSDVMTLIFLHRRHRVIEHPVAVRPRQGGRSTVSARTALDTVIEILNIVTLFSPMRIFLPLALLAWGAGFAWGIPIVLVGRGVSVGSMLAIVTGVVLFALGLLAEQLAAIRRRQADDG